MIIDPWTMAKFGKRILIKRRGKNGESDNQDKGFGTLATSSSDEIALKAVNISGEIDGLLFSSRISQFYRNETDTNLEITYAFPVGCESALMGLKARIGGKWLEGEVLEKKDACERYGAAKRHGNSAIMAEEASAGIYTVYPGVIGPGEEVEIAIQCVQLLSFEKDTIRRCIPTVIGERYGDTHVSGGSASSASVQADFDAYALAISISLRGALSKSIISSPSHSIVINAKDDRAIVELARDSSLDRDFVLALRVPDPNSYTSYLKSEDGWLVCANFLPQIKAEKQEALILKVFVDCSNSMDGGSLAQARRGFATIIDEVKDGDLFSCSRFGSKVEHLTPGLVECTATCRKEVKKLMRRIKANMGGTEMARALESVLATESPEQ